MNSMISPPSRDDLEMFLDEIPENVFGRQYVFLWNMRFRQFVLVETATIPAEGELVEAHVLPFN